MKIKQNYLGFGLFLYFFSINFAFAITVQLPVNTKDNLVFLDGRVTVKARYEDTLLDIARRYDLGHDQIKLLNQNVDRWLPGEGTKVKLSNSRLLPEAPRRGIVINLPELRLYYFVPHKSNEVGQVITHPLGIGRVDWETPLGVTKITGKRRNPDWYPPDSVKQEHAKDGDPLPDRVPAGPNNPLGRFAMRLGVPGYLIHGTNKPYGVGMRVSHGCIRMYPEDIQALFPMIQVGTPVNIVNQPIKAGWSGDVLYVEIHPEHGKQKGSSATYQERLENALNLIEKANNNQVMTLNGRVLKEVLRRPTGEPIEVFRKKK
ncbi:MAG: L,D-transpeptidase family protein [Methylococcaceae bacterium]